MQRSITIRLTFIAGALLLLGFILLAQESQHFPDDKSLFIHIWYGNEQTFGQLGQTQRWVNILGNVSPASQLQSLSYSVNASPFSPLSFHEDKKRLAHEGDFNIEIDRSLLKLGKNHVQVFATDLAGQMVRFTVSVEYIDTQKPWPLPYRIDWSEVDRIQDAVQVVDGKWILTKDGIRTVERYYDRVLALGDHTWHDYEVVTTVTFHAFTPPNSAPNTTNVTHAAIASRWPGHDTDKFQPHVKWYPVGATSEFRIGKDLQQCRWRIFDGKKELYVESQKRRKIDLGKKYWMKHRVETLADGRSLYRVKLWPTEGTEPRQWDMERYESGDLESGSALLIAHHTDVTFGNVLVSPIQPDRNMR